jgi:hypothetical protein
VEEYNNLDNLNKNSYSVNSNFESKSKNFIENLLLNKRTVIDILSKQSSNEEKQTLLKKILEEFEPAVRNLSEEPKVLKDNNASSSAIEHTKSMGVGDESHDSLLLDDDAPNKHLKDKMTSHSFHKRPLSQNNVLRSKSSRQKRRKKTPVGNAHKAQNSLISNGGVGSHSKATQDTHDGDFSKHSNKKLIDDSKFGKKGVVNASMRPKSSRGNRSFDNSNNIKGIKADGSMKHKRGSMAGVSKTSTNFGKKKNSYGGANQFQADKLMAKYRQARNNGSR